VEIGRTYHWDRDSLFNTGAYNLLDLLSRIPGVTTLRSGWLGSPQYAAYLGDPARVRIFSDGVELDPLDPRSGPALDLSLVPIWSLEDVSIERGADEIRVYLRSWRVQRTTTNTRVDVATGDLGTNIFRGFFGKRFHNGMALQLGAQQYSTTHDTRIGGGDELSLIGRLGWARGKWKVDLFGQRSTPSRDQQEPLLQGSTGGVPAMEATLTSAYARAAYGDPDSDGPWVQLMAASQKFAESTPFRTTALPFAPPDTADTTRSSRQYIAMAGITRGALRLSLAERFHVAEGRNLNSLAARVAYERPWIALSLYADHRGGDTSSTEEATVRFTPLGRVALLGSVARRHGGPEGPARYAMRGEAGVHLGRAWLSGGVMRRDAVTVPGLTAYNQNFTDGSARAATGIFGTVHGKVYGDIGVNIFGVRWSARGYYRPQYQTREEIYLDTRWLSRFPSGNFGLLASAAHEYRGYVMFPTVGSTEAFGGSPQVASYSHTLVTRIELRILDATIFFNSSYGIQPPIYEQVPGFIRPRQAISYGVRWQFWN
jgi:hypothetical protein